MSPYPEPESVLVMDNASPHNHFEIHEICARFRVIVIFLPPYSYDFNPIEMVFHQSKQFIRTKYGLGNGIIASRLAEGLAITTPSQACNYYRHCGYQLCDADFEWAGLL